MIGGGIVGESGLGIVLYNLRVGMRGGGIGLLLLGLAALPLFLGLLGGGGIPALEVMAT